MQASSKSHMCVLLMSHSHSCCQLLFKALVVPLSFRFPGALLHVVLGDIKQSKMTVDFMLNLEAWKNLGPEFKVEVLFAFDTTGFGFRGPSWARLMFPNKRWRIRVWAF